MTNADQKNAAIAVAVAMAMWLAIQVAGPDALGLSPVAYRWLGILAAGAAVAQGFLPSIKGQSKEADDLSDSIRDMSIAERATLQAMVDRVKAKRVG